MLADGFDNPAAGIPKLLEPVTDVDGDGTIGVPSGRHAGKRIVGAQNHVFRFRFYVPDGTGGRRYIEKASIAPISSPFVVPASVALPGTTGADHGATDRSAYVAVNITLRDPHADPITAYVENKFDGTPWLQWKQMSSCSAP